MKVNSAKDVGVAVRSARKKAGLTPTALGYETFFDFVEAAPEFTLSTNAKGVTYVNLKR